MPRNKHPPTVGPKEQRRQGTLHLSVLGVQTHAGAKAGHGANRLIIQIHLHLPGELLAGVQVRVSVTRDFTLNRNSAIPI